MGKEKNVIIMEYYNFKVNILMGEDGMVKLMIIKEKKNLK